MPRKPIPAPVVVNTPINEVVLADDLHARNQLAVIEQQRQQRLTDLAGKLGYQGSLGGEALMDGARAAKRRVGMAIMEFGAYLLLLKEGCEHGQFEQVLVELEIVPNTARTYMALTRRLAKHSTSSVLDSIGYGKAAELLGLDDDQIDELAEAGATGELALDDVARMSVRELRAAVRKERSVKQRLQAVNTELNGEVIQLKLDKKVVAQTDWPSALIPITDQVAAAGRKLATALSELETCRITLFEKANELGDDERASFEAALCHITEVYEEALARAERCIERERVTFDKTLGAFSS